MRAAVMAGGGVVRRTIAIDTEKGAYCRLALSLALSRAVSILARAAMNFRCSTWSSVISALASIALFARRSRRAGKLLESFLLNLWRFLSSHIPPLLGRGADLDRFNSLSHISRALEKFQNMCLHVSGLPQFDNGRRANTAFELPNCDPLFGGHPFEDSMVLPFGRVL